MPLTVPSHQAAVLPLKLWRPAWFAGTALAIGSAAPDLEYFLNGAPTRTIGHDLAGQFTYCLPLTLLFTWVLTWIVAVPLSGHLPRMGAFHFEDYRLLEVSARRWSYWPRAALCTLVGSFTHLIWDAFTHEHGLGARVLGYNAVVVSAGGRSIELFHLLQHISTGIGGLVALALLHRIGRGRLLHRWLGRDPEDPGSGPVRRATLASHAALWVTLFAVTAWALWDGVRWYYRYWGDPAFDYLWFASLVGLRTIRAAGAGLIAGCLLARPLMKRLR